MDVADILGVNKTINQKQDDYLKILEENKLKNNSITSTSTSNNNNKDNNNNNKDNNNKDKDKIKIKPKGMSRELFSLMGRDGITPSIQTNNQNSINIFKDKRQNGMHGKWVWSSFKNSARSDDLQCSHWIKAELQGYDYTYAKFNVKIEPISYKDSEYDTLLQNPNWTRSETDHLMFLCYEYDLRWPVIADRYESSSQRSVEELMNRYYFIVSKLKAHRNGQSDFTSKNTSSESFNIDYERARRKQQDLLFRKTPSEELEEAKIREELKSIDAQLKKLKKTTTNIKPTITLSENSTSNAPSRNNSTVRPTSNNSTATPPSSAATVLNPPIMMYGGGISSNTHGLFPSPGYPCLQSARLALHSESNQKYIHPDLSQSFTKKIIQLLQELGVPDRLLPTKKICDLNDEIRKDAAILLSLQNTIQKKEKELQTLKTYHETNGKRKDNSFILPHIGLLLNESDISLSEYYLNPTLIPTTVNTTVPGIATISNPPVRSTNKGHSRKSSSSSGGGSSTSIVNPLLGNTTSTTATTTTSSSSSSTQPKPQKRKASVVSSSVDGDVDDDGENSEIVVPIVKVQAAKKSKKQVNSSSS